MVNGINANSIGSSPIICRTRRSSATDESSLNDKEREALEQIRNRLGGSVEVKIAQRQAFSDVGGGKLFALNPNPNPSSASISIPKEMLAEMAECPKRFIEHMSWIQQVLREREATEISNRETLRKIEQYENEREVERRKQQIQQSMISFLDFWNDAGEENRSLMQAVQSKQQVADRYEQNLSVQN